MCVKLWEVKFCSRKIHVEFGAIFSATNTLKLSTKQNQANLLEGTEPHVPSEIYDYARCHHVKEDPGQKQHDTDRLNREKQHFVLVKFKSSDSSKIYVF